MAKIVVINEPDRTQEPFLRGILVQSLMKAGLPFEESYKLAQSVKEELRETPEISKGEIKELTAKLLDARFGREYSLAYQGGPVEEAEILVHTTTRATPFSEGILARSLEACGIPVEIAVRGASDAYERVRGAGIRDVEHRELRKIVYQCLREQASADAANRYLSWRHFENSGESLIVLIGGATGSGKSTIASEIAYRTDIARVQSTDMMREIIRSYLTPQASPTLQYSSFEAWRGLTPRSHPTGDTIETPVIRGYLSQVAALKPALEATLSRAVTESHDLIIEGIHVLPTLLDLDEASKQSVVVSFMIAAMNREILAKQLKRRGRERETRSGVRYLEHLDDIWALQSYLLAEADGAGIPIMRNDHLDSTIREVLTLIGTRIMERYPPDEARFDG